MDSRTKFARVIGYAGGRVKYDRIKKPALAYNHGAPFWEATLMCPTAPTGHGQAPPPPTHTRIQVSGKGNKGGGYSGAITVAKGKKKKTAAKKAGGPDSIHIFCDDPEQGGT